MPPTSLRYRPGQLSAQLSQAIADEAQSVADLDEPLVVIAAIGDVFAALDDALEQPGVAAAAGGGAAVPCRVEL